MEKKKIFFTIDTLCYGGAEKSTVEIVSKLSPEFEPVVVTFYNEYSLKPALEKSGIKVITIGLSGKYDFIKGIRAFKEICLREKPEIIVATLYRSEIISRIVAKRLGIKIIGTFVSDTYSPSALGQFPPSQLFKVRLFQILNRYTAKFCAGFISNAKSIKLSNAKALGVEPEKVEVIYRGRDISKFKLSHTELPAHTFKFINVGRLRAAKDQVTLIRSFALLKKIIPNISLDIAGEGPERAKLEALIRDLNLSDDVRLLGNISDIPSLLQQYHVFVFSSVYEGFSGALVEAMLAGIPVVASDIPMNTEAVEHLKTGIIFKTANAESCAEAMKYSIENYSNMLLMSKEAKNIAQRLYDLDSIVKQHEAVYRKYISSETAFSFT